MQGLHDTDFSIKFFFVPLTTAKAITWIVIIGIIVYANMLFNGFVWDDKTFILTNSDIHSINISFLFGSNSFNSLGQYRPVPAFYFATLYALFKDNPFFYHLLQLLVHIVNSILVFKLFNKFFNKELSLVSSIFFLIHPIQVESVSYIASSDNPLFFLCGISALLLSLKEQLDLKRYILIFALLLLSVLTKE